MKSHSSLETPRSTTPSLFSPSAADERKHLIPKSQALEENELENLQTRLNNIDECLDEINAFRSVTVCPNAACTATSTGFLLILGAMTYGMYVTGTDHRVRVLALETNATGGMVVMSNATQHCMTLTECALERTHTTDSDIVMYILAATATLLITAYSAYLANQVMKRREKQHLTNVFTKLPTSLRVKCQQVVTANAEALNRILDASYIDTRLTNINTTIFEFNQLRAEIARQITEKVGTDAKAAMPLQVVIHSLRKSGI